MPRGGKGYSELADAGPSIRPPPTMNRPGLAHLHTQTPPPTPESLMKDKDIDPERTSSAPATRTASESPPPPASPPPGHTDGNGPTNEGNTSRSRNRLRMKKWLKRGGSGDRLGKWNPALTLENSGSVARDHLASERTFLAYVRTSLAIASTGVALVQLFTISAAATTDKAIQAYARPLGAVVITIGLGTLILGTTRYFAIQNALIGGNYPVARVSTILLALVLCAIVIVVFGIIVGVRSKS